MQPNSCMSNMSMLEKTKLLFRKYQIHPNRLLGQNYMIEPSIFQRMTEYASLGQNDVVLDAGAGLGFLTRFLADRCKNVLAVEVDKLLVHVLSEQLKDLPNVTVIVGNVLKTHVPQFNKAVSIPPYQISSRLLLWLLRRSLDFSVLILQEEFANRLVAPVGSEDYGWLRVFTYYRGECELLDKVPKRDFYPQPDVDSTIIRLKPKSPPPFIVTDEALFIKLVQNLFTQRNRRVKNAIRPFMRTVLAKSAEDTQSIVQRIPFRDERARRLTPEDFGTLANAIFN